MAWSEAMNARWDFAMQHGDGAEKLASLIEGRRDYLDGRDERILEAYKNGMPIREIIGAFGTNSTRISAIARAAGVPGRKRRKTVVEIDGELQEEYGDEFRADIEAVRPQSRPVVPIHEMREAIVAMTKVKRQKSTGNSRGDRQALLPEIIRLYQGGMSAEKIGERLGVNAGTVRSWLKGAGVEIRPRYSGRQHKKQISIVGPGVGVAITEAECDEPDPTPERWQAAIDQPPIIIEDDEPDEELPGHLWASAKEPIPFVPTFHQQDNADMLIEAMLHLSPLDIIRLRKRLGRVIDEEVTDFLQKLSLDMATQLEEVA